MRGRELLPYTERTSRSTVTRNPDRRRGLPTTVRLGSHSGFDGSGGRKEVSRPSRERTYKADVRQRALDPKVDLVALAEDLSDEDRVFVAAEIRVVTAEGQARGASRIDGPARG